MSLLGPECGIDVSESWKNLVGVISYVVVPYPQELLGGVERHCRNGRRDGMAAWWR